jgi:hypothetical protein
VKAKNPIVFVWIAAALVFVVAAYELGVMRSGSGHEMGPVRRTTYSAASGGYKALYLWLQALGLPAVRWERDLGELSNEARVLLLVQPRFAPERQEIRALLDWIRGGGVLLLVADPFISSLYRACGLHTVAGAEQSGEDAPLPTQPGPYTRGVRRILSTAGTGVTPADPEGVVHIKGAGDLGLLVVRELGDGRVIALTDPEIFCNRMLRQGDHARLAVNLLLAGYRGGLILIDEYHQGYGRINSVLEHLSRSRSAKPLLLGMFLCLFLGMRLGKRFGEARPVITRTRRSSMEYVQAMGRLLQRSGSRGFVLESHIRWTKEEAGRLLVSNEPGLQAAMQEAMMRLQIRRLGDRTLLGAVKGLHRALMRAKHRPRRR